MRRQAMIPCEVKRLHAVGRPPKDLSGRQRLVCGIFVPCDIDGARK